MHKRSTVTITKGKANTNVTIIKFKTPEASKRKQALVSTIEEQDPLVRKSYLYIYLCNKNMNFRLLLISICKQQVQVAVKPNRNQ